MSDILQLGVSTRPARPGNPHGHDLAHLLTGADQAPVRPQMTPASHGGPWHARAKPSPSWTHARPGHEFWHGLSVLARPRYNAQRLFEPLYRAKMSWPAPQRLYFGSLQFFLQKTQSSSLNGYF